MRRILLTVLLIGILFVLGALFRGPAPAPGTALQPGNDARLPDQIARRDHLEGTEATGPSNTSSDAAFRRKLREHKRWSSPFQDFVVEGRVLSTENEQVVSGTRVAFYDKKNPATEEFEAAALEAFSSQEGNYRLHSNEPLSGWIAASKGGYTAVEEKIHLVQPGMAQQDFSISPAEAVAQGLARDLFSSAPLPSVSIKWFIPEDVLKITRSSLSPRITFTDQMGWYELTDLPTGRAALKASFPGFFETTQTVQLEAGVNQIDIRLVRGDSFTLKVEGRDGETIAHAMVERPDGQVVAADEEGIVEMALLPEFETIHCGIWADGYLRLDADLNARDAFQVVRLEPAPEVHGWVISSYGEPVVDARLHLHGTRGLAAHREKPVYSDGSGAFSRGLSDPPLQRIQVTHPAYIDEWIRFDEHPFDPVVIRLRSQETALAGSVFGQAGLPVRRFTVEVMPADSSMIPQPFSKFFDSSDGRFLISSVPPGKYQVSVFRLMWSESTPDVLILESPQRDVELTRGNITRIRLQMAEAARVPGAELQGYPGALAPGENPGQQ